MAKNLLLLAGGALLFAIGLADLVGDTRISRYILLLAGVCLGAWAVYRIQRKP